MRRATITDVAREAGVSLGSVSRVLNDLPVSVSMKQRVNAAITKLKYEPNGLAQSMRTRSTGAVGCLVPDISNPLYGAILTALDSHLRHEGYMLLLANSAEGGRAELDVIAEFKRRRVDALVIAPGSEKDQELVTALDNFGAPVVILGRELPTSYSSVQVDHRAGTKAAAKYLIGLGHSRIALLTPLSELAPGRLRIEGLQSAYADAGIDQAGAIIRPQYRSLDPGVDVAQLLDAKEPPTALIVLGTRILAGTLRAIRDRNLKIPGDLSIISIGDTDWTAVHNPPITSLRWNEEDIARPIVELLLLQIKGSLRTLPQRVSVPIELVLRDSCAPPRIANPAGSLDVSERVWPTDNSPRE